MKKLALATKIMLGFALLCGRQAVAQTTPNLLINGDFEQRNVAPEGPGRSGGDSNIGPIQAPYALHDDLKYWTRTATVNAGPSTPSYIASDGQQGSNTNNYGFTAHNSNSCIIIGRHDAPADKSLDDFVTQELSQRLSKGHIYHIEFWVLRFGNSQYHNKLAISITSNTPTYDGAQNSLIPSPGSKVLVSPDIQQYYTWVQVAGDIIIPASDNGNNKWLTIGNDRSDQTYDSSLPNSGLGGLAYAIDDISLVDLGCADPEAFAYQDFGAGTNCNNVANFIISNYDPAVAYTFTGLQGGPRILRTGDKFTVKVSASQMPFGATFTMTATSPCGGVSTSEEIAASYPCGGPTSNRTAIATTAYPNPANESISVPEEVESAALLNSAGKPVQKADASGKLDVQSLPDGLYNLQMMQNGKLINQRIQVKH